MIIVKTVEEKEIASKVSTWLRVVEKDGECGTSPLTKEKRHIVYKILEAKGIYEWDKYYPGDGTEGLIIRKK